jgi:ribosomal protein S18 acetylase RimI-like enzyme
MVSLRPMTEDEFQSFLAEDIPTYAAEKVRAGTWKPEEAISRSKDEHAQLLPGGLHSPHQHLYTIEDNGRAVGRLWLSSDPLASAGAGFIYDLHVEEASRRQGIGREAMLALEIEARRLGLHSLALHVFGDNQAARSLYEKLDYRVTDINMEKKIGP